MPKKQVVVKKCHHGTTHAMYLCSSVGLVSKYVAFALTSDVLDNRRFYMRYSVRQIYVTCEHFMNSFSIKEFGTCHLRYLWEQ